jgi:hypothetical protein
MTAREDRSPAARPPSGGSEQTRERARTDTASRRGPEAPASGSAPPGPRATPASAADTPADAIAWRASVADARSDALATVLAGSAARRAGSTGLLQRATGTKPKRGSGKGSKPPSERQRNEQVRMWKERLVERVGGLTAGDAEELAKQVIALGRSVADAELLAKLVVAGWTPAAAVAFARNLGSRKIADWLDLTKLTDDGWTGVNISVLTRLILRDDPQLPVGNWMRFATRVPNDPGAVAAFVHMAGWSRETTLALATEYATSSGGLHGGQWVQLAGAGAGLRNQADDVALFARVPRWTFANRLALATLYGAYNGPRGAAHWCAVAGAHAAIADHENDVAALIAIGPGWSRAGLRRLARTYAGTAVVRPVADWVALADCHAMFAEDERAVAVAVREQWTAATLGPLATAALAGGMTQAKLKALLAVSHVAAGMRALAGLGWTGTAIGGFIGALLGLGVGARGVTRLLRTPNIATALNAMTPTWSAPRLGAFVRAALRCGITPVNLAALMTTVGMPNASHALITGGWTAEHVGELLARASVAGADGQMIHGLISTANVPARMRLMTAAGWTHGNLGALLAEIRLAGGVDNVKLASLLNEQQFRTGSLLMHNAHWRPRLQGRFVAGALSTPLTVTRLAALVNEAGFAAAAYLWLAPGWKAKEVGTIAGRAMLRQASNGALANPELTAGQLRTCLNTPNAAQSAWALRNAPWGFLELGNTIGYCLTRQGRPSDAQFEQLLVRAAVPITGRQIEPLWLRKAANAIQTGSGTARIAPSWAEVLLHAPTFQANHDTSARAHADEVLATSPLLGVGANGYRIRLNLFGAIIHHVEHGHTFEYFEFSYANCTRQGVGINGHCTFFGVGEDVPAKLRGFSGAAQPLAGNAVLNVRDGGNRQTQGVSAGCTIACKSGPTPGGYQPTYNARISQCYPNAGTRIKGRDLVALGRFFGYMG